jgi:hypothetical protein
MDTRRVSVVICAYNEAERIGDVLWCLHEHPLVGEIIVIDDGSSDDTSEEAAAFNDVTLVRNNCNRGKSWSLARGIEVARLDTLMLLDADLSGLSAAHVTQLAAPVLCGRADVTISLRRDSFYRPIGLDFVSGERVLPRAVLTPILASLRQTSRWGAEILINEMIIANALRLEVIDWRAVGHASKLQKSGLRGALADLRMAGEIITQLKASGMLRQNLGLRHAARLARSIGARGYDKTL